MASVGPGGLDEANFFLLAGLEADLGPAASPGGVRPWSAFRANVGPGVLQANFGPGVFRRISARVSSGEFRPRNLVGEFRARVSSGEFRPGVFRRIRAPRRSSGDLAGLGCFSEFRPGCLYVNFGPGVFM
jgi:hypothetical protein